VAKLIKAGFDNIDIEPTRIYSIEDARAFLAGQGLDVDALARELGDKFISAFVRANKPATACAVGEGSSLCTAPASGEQKLELSLTHLPQPAGVSRPRKPPQTLFILSPVSSRVDSRRLIVTGPARDERLERVDD
jgi:hypothetical protein